jgi:hypothetical protein
MATLYYQPAPGDFEQTSVCDGRFRFAAYQPVEMPEDPAWANVVATLKANPAFGDSINEERQQKWNEWRQAESARRAA